MAVALLGSLLLAFRELAWSGFDRLTADRYDGVIAHAIVPHWREVLAGRAAWDTLPWFHPHGGTLAYNDGYLLHGLLHAGFAGLGLDPLLSSELATAALLAVGFGAVAHIARRRLGMGLGWSLLAGALVVGSNNLFLAILHNQLAALGPALLVLDLGWGALAAASARRPGRALLLGACAAILYGAVLLTAFYVAWVLAAATALALLLLVLLSPRPTALLAPPGWAALAGVAAVAAIAALPALALYLPLATRSGLHPLEGARGWALGPLSILDAGTGNLFWGWASPVLGQAADGTSLSERYLPRGLPLLTAATAAAGLVLALARARREVSARLVASAGLAALLLTLLTVDFGALWLWPLLHRVVPAAGAIRETSRVLLLTTPALLLAACWLLSRAPRHLAVPAAALGTLLLVEQVNLLPIDRLSRAATLARLDALPPAPPGCTAFVPARPREGVVTGRIPSIYSHNVEAMLIASLRRLPTVAGFSSFTPPGWDFADPNLRRYDLRVAAYAERHGLRDGLCGLDLRDLAWTGPGAPLRWEPAPPVPPPGWTGARLGMGIAGAPPNSTLDGFAHAEEWGVWTIAESARLEVPLPPGWRGGGTLVLELNGSAPRTGTRPASVRVGEGPEHALRLRNGEFDSFALPFDAADAAAGRLTVLFRVPDPASPASLGLGSDVRTLGVGLRALALLP